MELKEVLEKITKADIESAKDLKNLFDEDGTPWRTMVDGEIWSMEDSRIIQTITYLRLNEVK